MQCAVILITHQLNVCMQSDQVVVLNEGKQIQRGSYSELLKEKDGLFAKLMTDYVDEDEEDVQKAKSERKDMKSSKVYDEAEHINVVKNEDVATGKERGKEGGKKVSFVYTSERNGWIRSVVLLFSSYGQFMVLLLYVHVYDMGGSKSSCRLLVSLSGSFERRRSAIR